MNLAKEKIKNIVAKIHFDEFVSVLIVKKADEASKEEIMKDSGLFG